MSAHVRDRLSAYLDGEVDPSERSAVDAHLAQCPACAARLSELALVDSAVAGLSLPETRDDAAFAARVRARIEAEGGRASQARPGPPRRQLPAWAWAAAAAVLVAVVTPLTLRELRPSNERPALESLGPADAQAPIAAHAGDAASPPAVLPPPAVPRPAILPPRGATSNDLAPSAQAGRRNQGVATRSEAALPQSSVERKAAPAPAAPPLEGGAAGGVVGGAPDAQVTYATAPEKTPSDREVLAKQEPVGPRERLADEPQRWMKSGARAPATFAGKPPSEDEAAVFARLAAERPTTAEEWRGLREAWREQARALAGQPLADEALVRAIEAAAGAYRASKDAQDERVLGRDAAEYLARKGAPQGDRVRRLLHEATRD